MWAFRSTAIILSVTGLLCGCAAPSTDPTASVYSGGDILTMVGDQPAYVEALAVRDGKIVAAGSKAQALKAAGRGARQVDLKGATLLPGFIDAHSHVLNYADSLVQANLNPPPVGASGRSPTLSLRSAG